jgi:nucleotide-binding universal stress UspA family protein
MGGGAAVTVPDVYVPIDPALDGRRREDRHGQVREQLERVGIAEPWTIEVREGAPGIEIAGRANEIGAGLVVVGLTRHSVLDRILGRERALNIVRASPVPVLAVPGEFPGRPARIVVGVDFTPASLDAARAAFVVASVDALVQLVHVRASETRQPDVLAEWHANYQNALDGGFALLESQIDVPPGVQLEHHAIGGRVAHTLLARAEEWNADLVIVATHGGGAIRRMTTGSVTSQVIRQATRPVLVMPAR